MRLFKSKSKKEWEHWLRTATEKDLAAERWELTKEIRERKELKREIQAEVDRRAKENPPERGQVVHV